MLLWGVFALADHRYGEAHRFFSAWRAAVDRFLGCFAALFTHAYGGRFLTPNPFPAHTRRCLSFLWRFRGVRR